ncbi:MAG: PaaI family thioesterase [Clostridiales bacterium]|nr:PaaI family thioesterase [Clostridiales bacterium]
MDYLTEAREIFKNDIYATETNGIVIEAADINYARCSVEIDRRHRNASNVVMGGALFTLADFTFAVASNMGNPLTVSVTSQITYLNPAFGNKMTAEAECLKSGKSSCTFTIRITDENGKLIAVVTTTGYRTNKTIEKK